MRQIVVADPRSELTPWVDAITVALAGVVTYARSGDELEHLLLTEGPFDLVVTMAQLDGRSGLQVLARARGLRMMVPFIVVTSTHGHLARVMVSDASAQTLSSRMLDRSNVAALARVLTKDSYRPAGFDGGPGP